MEDEHQVSKLFSSVIISDVLTFFTMSMSQIPGFPMKMKPEPSKRRKLSAELLNN